MGISTSTGTLVAGTSRTFDLAPASAITLTLPPNCRVTITESPATVTATSLGGNATRVHNPRLPGTFTYGPYPMGGSVLVENGSSSGSTVTWVRSDSLIAENAAGGISLVSGDGSPVLRSGRPRSATLKKSILGRVQSLANGADHTSSYMTTLECHADRFRIWVVNPIAADLTNVRVSVGTSDTLPAALASLHGSTTTSGAILSNGALSTGSAFTVAAGTDINAVNATASPWLDIGTIDRADGGTLPLIRVRVEVPAANANRPAINTSSNTALPWDTPVDAAGRVMQMRIGAGLGVTTPAAAASTAWDNTPVPIIIEYQPRFGVGTTVMILGDSIQEGYGATIFGYGFHQMARADLSTMQRPIEICNMASGSSDINHQVSRAEAIIPLLLPDVVISPNWTPNGVSPPTITATSFSAMARALGRVRAAARSLKAEYIGLAGAPILAVAPDPTSGSENYDAATVVRLNTYMAGVLAADGNVIDSYTPLSGPPDAEGQVTNLVGTSADGIHLNSTGYRIMADATIPVLRAVIG